MNKLIYETPLLEINFFAENDDAISGFGGEDVKPQ